MVDPPIDMLPIVAFGTGVVVGLSVCLCAVVACVLVALSDEDVTHSEGFED